MAEATPRSRRKLPAKGAQPRPQPPEPTVSPRNTLNDLVGRDWIKFTKSWLVCDSRRYLRNKDTELHPARYPEELVSEFVQFFTKTGQWVLDPFCGSGATLVSCHETGRRGVGLELSRRYYEVARERLAALGATDCLMLHGDASRVGEQELWEGWTGERGEDSLPRFDFLMTSPPYFDMLHKSRGGVVSVHKKRAQAGLDTVYSGDQRDLGNISDYDEYLEALGGIFDACAALLKPRRYLVAVIQNMRDVDGEVRPMAWDLARRLSRHLSFQGERIWCQNSKPLGIWGYPTVFVPNYHHHYCLIFRKR